MTKLELQRLAMSGYEPDDYPPEELTDHTVNEDGALDGDGLAQFIWHEVRDADGDSKEAVRMLRVAIRQLEQVINTIYGS